MDAHVVPPGEGERFEVAGGVAVMKATRETTGGAFSMSEGTLPPGYAGPPPHLHRRTTDCFYVLEGDLRVLVGTEWVDVPAGSFVAVPPGVVHTFANPGASPARILNLNSPAGWELYLRDLAAAVGEDGAIDAEAFARAAAAHDVMPAPAAG